MKHRTTIRNGKPCVELCECTCTKRGAELLRGELVKAIQRTGAPGYAKVEVEVVDGSTVVGSCELVGRRVVEEVKAFNTEFLKISNDSLKAHSTKMSEVSGAGTTLANQGAYAIGSKE